jgi:hypothetical protein
MAPISLASGGKPYAKGTSGSGRMALLMFLRGVNVGGHRTFRPTKLAEQLKHLDVVNIGAAGTLVIRRAITPTRRHRLSPHD